jgi:ABC-type glycerol-3-phosphate transport system permease component
MSVAQPKLPTRDYQLIKKQAAVLLAYGLLVVAVVVSIYPLAVMVLNSLKSNDQVLVNPAGLPSPATASDYSDLLTRGQLHAFLNSLIVSVSTTVGAVFISALAGYAFTKVRFPGRTVLFLCLVATIMVPVQTAMPGFYTEFAALHWINTYQVQIVPFLAPVFGLFMMRQYMLTIPDSIIEAARIDGAGEWRIFRRVLLPIARPALAALAVLEFLLMWNGYIWPQVMASDPSVAPLSVTLPTLTDSTLGIVPLYGTIMAGSVLATVPLILVFLRYQDTFMTGITYGNT